MTCAQCKQEIARTSQSCPACGTPVSRLARARARAMTDGMASEARMPQLSVSADQLAG